MIDAGIDGNDAVKRTCLGVGIELDEDFGVGHERFFLVAVEKLHRNNRDASGAAYRLCRLEGRGGQQPEHLFKVSIDNLGKICR